MPKLTRRLAARRRLTFVLSLLVILILAFIGLRVWYSTSLKPLASSGATQDFTVNNGDSVTQIAGKLQADKLIKSDKAFETYVRVNPFVGELQAGTYVLAPSMSVRTIVHKMSTGDVAKNYVTILPGQRLDQIKQAFIKTGYTSSQVDAAFKPANYLSNPALASLPTGASLEGYLYPDSFQKETGTPATTLINEDLSEFNQQLTPALINAFNNEGLTTYQGITLASIVYQETGNPADQPTVAQVFLSRLKQNISLGSDVTAYYASALAGQPKSVDIDSPYNTRLHTGLPPGPIGNVTASALNAVARPSSTSYLFFVAGDDKKIHFSNTEAEHEAAIAQYCKLSCGH